MFLETFEVGIYAVNCYIVADDNKVGAVIDPGGNVDKIKKLIDKRGLDIKYILLTHGHGDHIGAVEQLKNKTGAKVAAHKKEKEILNDKDKNLTGCMGVEHISFDADEYFSDGDIIKVGELKFEVIHTPGHTPGGSCFRLGDYLFTGDTLFTGSIGRTDLFGADPSKMENSLKRLKSIDEDLKVLPGHGRASSLEFEKERNPYMNGV